MYYTENLERWRQLAKMVEIDQYLYLSPQRARTDAYGYLRYQTPLSSSHVLSILESRKETLDLEEYEKLLGFFSGVRDKIDQVNSQQQRFRQGNRF